MDFIGMRESEQEDLASIATIYGSTALVYDQRFRNRSSEEDEQAFAIGLVPDNYDFHTLILDGDRRSVLPHRVSFDQVKLACSVYLAMEPHNIAFDHDGLCQQRRESFRHWLAVKTSLLRFGPKYLLFGHQHIPKLRHQLNKHHHHSNPSVTKLFKNFVSLPKEVVCDSKLAVQFGLPVIAETSVNSRVLDEWLALMSWWHTIVSELHPTLCELRSMSDSKKDNGQHSGLPSVNHLRVEYDRCLALRGSSFPEELNNFLAPEYEKLLREQKNFPSLKIPKEANRTFLRNVLQLTTDLTRVVVIYLVNVRNQNGEECLSYLEAKTLSYISRVHDDIKDIYRPKYLYSVFEADECRHFVLRQIEVILRKYSKKKFNITSVFGGMEEVHQRTIHRIYKFIRRIMDVISTAFIEIYCSYYAIKLKKAYAKRVVKNLVLHVTWTSMNVVLNSTNFPKSREEDVDLLVLAAYPLRMTEAETVVTPEVIYDTIRKTCEAIQHCNDTVFTNRPRVVQSIQLPVSYVYQDFTYFLMAFSENFSTCPHPVMDLHALTEGRIRTFLTEMLVCLHNNMPAIDQVMQNAKAYLKLKQHM